MVQSVGGLIRGGGGGGFICGSKKASEMTDFTRQNDNFYLKK